MKLYGSLDNYIQMHRRRMGLSQSELSVLVFLENRGSVSRYEQGLRVPDLETLLALEIVFGAPAQELFAGIAERVRDEVSGRAKYLLEGIGDAATVENAMKLDVLSRLAHPDDPQVVPLWEDEA